MSPETVKALSTATPSPRGSAARLKFVTSFSANREIARLENLLGIPASAPQHNLVKANAHIEKLTTELSARTAATPAVTAEAAASNQQEAQPKFAVLDHYASITDSVDRVQFYREHAKEIDSAHRALKRTDRPAPQRAATGYAVLDQYNSIQHPAEKMAFYRKNSAAIDVAIETIAKTPKPKTM